MQINAKNWVKWHTVIIDTVINLHLIPSLALNQHQLLETIVDTGAEVLNK